MNYEYRYLMEYIPKRYSATMKQENDREVIYDFKNGYCSLSLMNTIVECIKEIKNEIGGYNWRVCFIPASTHHKTACRYQKLATFIEKETELPATTIPSCQSRTRNQATSQARRQTRQRTSTSRQATLPARTSSS